MAQLQVTILLDEVKKVQQTAEKLWNESRKLVRRNVDDWLDETKRWKEIEANEVWLRQTLNELQKAEEQMRDVIRTLKKF